MASEQIGMSKPIIRTLILGMKSEGCREDYIAQRLNIELHTVKNALRKARKAGFNHNNNPIIVLDSFVFDRPRPGAPRKQEDMKDRILEKVRLDRYGREKTCAFIASELSEAGNIISSTTVWRALKKAGMRKTKPTRKPGLSDAMKKARLEWCLAHQHWTLEDFKNVIWTDESAVVLLHRRGGYRVWRLPNERYIKSCIRPRWKGACEFMFWGSFSYDKKGPCHCWKPETAPEKRRSEEMISAWNSDREPKMKEEWELDSGLSRMGLRNKPGRAPQWKFTEKTGKLSRAKSKGGIDWFRYNTVILVPKLLPFALECQISRPNTVVQEDKAPAHTHFYQKTTFDLAEVQRLIWPGNSPDLNAIEAAWPYLKRETTKKGAPKNRSEAQQAWQKAWYEIPQEKIQAWIERIPYHIQRIIALGGGNEYQEGRRIRP